MARYGCYKHKYSSLIVRKRIDSPAPSSSPISEEEDTMAPRVKRIMTQPIVC